MNMFTKSSVLAVALVAASAASAFAEERVEVKVPFPFVVKGKELPAGQYDVRINERGVVSIQGENNRESAIALSIPAEGRDPLGAKPALVFTRFENLYRLSQVWDGLGDGQWLVGQHSARRQTRAAADATTVRDPVYVLATRVG